MRNLKIMGGRGGGGFIQPFHGQNLQPFIKKKKFDHQLSNWSSTRHSAPDKTFRCSAECSVAPRLLSRAFSLLCMQASVLLAVCAFCRVCYHCPHCCCCSSSSSSSSSQLCVLGLVVVSRGEKHFCEEKNSRLTQFFKQL